MFSAYLDSSVINHLFLNRLTLVSYFSLKHVLSFLRTHYKYRFSYSYNVKGFWVHSGPWDEWTRDPPSPAPTLPWKPRTTRLGTHDFIWGSVYPFILHLPLLAKRYKRCSLANDVIQGAWLQECVACCQSLKRRWLSERTISFHVLFLPETVMNLIAHQYKSVKHCL